MEQKNLVELTTKLILLASATDEKEKARLKKEIADYSNEQDCGEEGFLEFTQKEISKMPQQFRKIFTLQGLRVHARKRNEGRYKSSIEIRYAKKPYNNPPISASGTTPEEAKAAFIEKLKVYKPKEKHAPAVPKDFNGFAMYWFENFHKRKVAEETYKKNLATYKHDIQKAFGTTKLPDIFPVQVQTFLEAFNEKGRTKETLHNLLNQIFESAINHGIIRLNPLKMCFYQKHEREHGIAISKENEIELLRTYKNTEFEIDFAVLLYTGLRPCEYKTATIVGRFIKSQNRKRKGGKIEYKHIPISPMLRPYLENVHEIKLHHPSTIDKRLKKVLPNHTLKDMRTTFQTRLDECGVPDKVIGLFMGNTIGKGDRVKEAYTDINDPDYLNYLYNEGQKLNY